MKKSEAVAIGGWVLAAALSAAWIWDRPPVWPGAAFRAARPEKAAWGPPAFLNAAWGMSPAEVASANHARLEATQSSRKFYTAQKPEHEKRYSSFQQTGVSFLGRPTVVNYVFLDGRLCIYHVFLEDRDGETLDRDVRRYLVDRFGDLGVEADEEGPLRLVWNLPDLVVNYWFSRKALSLADKYEAGFGASYRPIERSLGAS